MDVLLQSSCWTISYSEGKGNSNHVFVMQLHETPSVPLSLLFISVCVRHGSRSFIPFAALFHSSHLSPNISATHSFHSDLDRARLESSADAITSPGESSVIRACKFVNHLIFKINSFDCQMRIFV